MKKRDFTNFRRKIAERRSFSFALIAVLIYNRICIGIVGKCKQNSDDHLKSKEKFNLMRSFKKKLSVFFAGALLACSAVSFAGCGGYNPTALSGDIGGEVKSNGGFVVEKGNYVYFINGAEASDADNTYGDVVKGALYRIDKASLKKGDHEKAECVVPSLFVSQNYDDGGLFLYGDYVYFASPTTEKEKDGAVANTWLSFKRAKLDGSSTQEEIDEYFFRLDDNTVPYRFVQSGDTVYCMYQKSGNLYSVNLTTKETNLLVAGASAYYFDTEDAENGKVYYLMNVPTDVTADASTYQYNQIYCVTPDATATVDAANTSYTVDGYKTYSFDKQSLEKANEEFDASDLSQYPYVNLGRLVADGRGSGVAQTKTQYNDTDDVNASKNAGYKYAILAYRSGRLLFTRADNEPVSSDTPVFTFTESDREGATAWNAVLANQTFMKVSDVSTNATASAAYYEAGNDALGYLYVSNSNLYRTVVNADGTLVEDGTLLSKADVTNLWKTDGTYLYYYGSGSSGNSLYRINYTGAAKDYNPLLQPNKEGYAEYAPSKILDVQWNDSWYKPEFSENVLLYCNAQSFGSRAFNYVYTANLNDENGDMMNAQKLNAFNEKYEEITDYIDDFSDIGDDGSDFVLALKYYFRTGETAAYDEFLEEAAEKGYKEHYRFGDFAQAEFKAFTTHGKNGDVDYAEKFKDENGTRYDRETYFINQLGETKASDAEDLETIWRTDFILPLPSEEEEETVSTAKKVWLTIAVVAGVAAVGAGITIPVVRSQKKKAQLAANLAATSVKNKIDMNVDQNVDLYATEETEQEGASAETVEETAGEEPKSEETVEATLPAEETEQVSTDPSEEEATAEEEPKQE